LRQTGIVLVAVGDLLDDVVVRLAGPIRRAADTVAVIERRQGGSAANVAVAAAKVDGVARFIGQVGDDLAGRGLLADLASHGVDVQHVCKAGRTGSIVVLVDHLGERTMLTDRGVAPDLAAPESAWLDGASVLHVPWYSLAGGAIARTAATLIECAHERSIPVSIDVSSTALWEGSDAGEAWHRIDRLAPTVVFANIDEAGLLGIDRAIGQAVTVVKRGAAPAIVHLPDGTCASVPAWAVSDGADTTGAGDAFAAGFLTCPDWRADPVAACHAAHAAAAALLNGRR
jgi:sugar/nucleoside kinase (ribokinase family)